jgi:tetratricopeptide (TPR) repeat protein
MKRIIPILCALALLVTAPDTSAQAVSESNARLDRAVDLHAMGATDDAYSAFQETLEEARHVFGHEDYAMAEELLMSWIAHFEQLAGESPAHLRLPRSYLARATAELDGPAAALADARELFEGLEGESPDTPDVRLAQGRVEEARSIGEVRMAQLRTKSATDDRLAEGFGSLDLAHKTRQRPGADFREVSSRMGRTVDILSDYLGADDPELLMIQVEQGQALLVNQDSIATGKHLIDQALGVLRGEAELNRLHIARTLSVLAIGFAQQSDLDEAQDLLEQSLALYVEDGAQTSDGYEAPRQNLCRVVSGRGLGHELCE